MQVSKTLLASLGLAVAVSGAAGLQAAETKENAQQTYEKAKSETKESADQTKQKIGEMTSRGRSQLDPQAVEDKFIKFYDEVANNQKWGRLNEYVTQDYKEHDPMPGAKATKGPDVLRETYQQIFAAFPDGKFEVKDIVVQGDQAVARYTFTGTHKGAFMNMQPTNKKVEITGFDWATINNDMKATEHWGFWDSASLMQQLRPKQQAKVE